MNFSQLMDQLTVLKSKYGECPSQVKLNTNHYDELKKSVSMFTIISEPSGFESIFGLKIIVDNSVDTPQFK